MQIQQAEIQEQTINEAEEEKYNQDLNNTDMKEVRFELDSDSNMS